MLRSLRNRLALLFFVITLTPIAGIYLYVAPQLESSLREEKLRGLAGATRQYASPLLRSIGTSVPEAAVSRAVRQAADRWRIPVRVVAADPRDVGGWLVAMAGAGRSLVRGR